MIYRPSCLHCSRSSARRASTSARRRGVRPTRCRSALNAVGRDVQWKGDLGWWTCRETHSDVRFVVYSTQRCRLEVYRGLSRMNVSHQLINVDAGLSHVASDIRRRRRQCSVHVGVPIAKAMGKLSARHSIQRQGTVSF